ncbi:hypothetical protein JTB14_029071 [Gonioctena quinquepunctata]|nr:hypothetical protein JTB14_029071 [Gonioctena quinquepunctata]
MSNRSRRLALDQNSVLKGYEVQKDGQIISVETNLQVSNNQGTKIDIENCALGLLEDHNESIDQRYTVEEVVISSQEIGDDIDEQQVTDEAVGK